MACRVFFATDGQILASRHFACNKNEGNNRGGGLRAKRAENTKRKKKIIARKKKKKMNVFMCVCSVFPVRKANNGKSIPFESAVIERNAFVEQRTNINKGNMPIKLFNCSSSF